MNALPSRSFVETVSQITTRLIFVGSIAWLGLIVADNVIPITRSWDATSHANDNSQKAASISELMTTVDGYWTFEGTDLSTQNVICNEHELANRFDSLFSIEDAESPPIRDATYLVAMAESNGAIKTKSPAGYFWTLNKPGLRLRLLTSDSETPGLIGAAFAIQDNKRWQLTMLKPHASKHDHLLPLPAEAKTVCARRSESGQLQVELVSTDQPGEQLLRHWQSVGWEVQPTPWGKRHGFSYVCGRGDAVVYAWSERSTGARTIMLSSTILNSTTEHSSDATQ